ncbi:hypothetical protein DsansV1_C04g0047111 [Dioscorea sansibarensis]
MSPVSFLIGIVVFIFLNVLHGIQSWGEEGHYTTCKIAQGLLSEETAKAVKSLLLVLGWMKSVINLNGIGVVLCIMLIHRTYYATIITAVYNLTEALLFLSHFMGDIHQVWDDLIIESAMKNYSMDLSMMIEGIQRNITEDWANDLPAWESCRANLTVCPNCLACEVVYKNASPGSTLGDDYFFTSLPYYVQKRLAQGGVRLAATLNRVFLGENPLVGQLPDDIYPECSSNGAYNRENLSAC